MGGESCTVLRLRLIQKLAMCHIDLLLARFGSLLSESNLLVWALGSWLGVLGFAWSCPIWGIGRTGSGPLDRRCFLFPWHLVSRMASLRPWWGSSPRVSKSLWAWVVSLPLCWSCSVHLMRSPPLRWKFSTHLGLSPLVCLWVARAWARWEFNIHRFAFRHNFFNAFFHNKQYLHFIFGD